MSRGITYYPDGFVEADVYGPQDQGLSSKVLDPVQASLMQWFPVKWLTIATNCLEWGRVCGDVRHEVR